MPSRCRACGPITPMSRGWPYNHRVEIPTGAADALSRSYAAPPQARVSPLPTRTFTEPSIESMTPVSSVLYVFSEVSCESCITSAITSSYPGPIRERPIQHIRILSYACRSERGRARGRRSMQAKAQCQQYLAPPEEKAVVEFMLRMSALGQPFRIKHGPCIAFSATRHRPASDRPLKPPGKNWAKALEKRHPELQARRVKALNWNRHEKNKYAKTAHWFCPC